VTRVNCIPVEELTGPHLVAEYRELPRVYGLARRALARGERPDQHPDAYVLGPGHVRFFYSRLGWIRERQRCLILEMQRRGYRPTFTDLPCLAEFPSGWRRNWTPDEAAMTACRARIRERGG
jgi:hypothetical protein